MGTKLFIILVVVLSILIIASVIGLVMSINRYNNITSSNEKVIEVDDFEVLDDEDEEEEPIKEIKEDKNEVIYESSSNNSSSTNNSNTSNSSYILPSDTRLLTSDDLKDMTYDELNLAYNEIFARHGHDFQNENLRNYFKKQSWYKPVSGKSVLPSELNEFEAKNYIFIKNRIDEIKK